MRGFELQIARKLLGLSIAEAAEYIGQVSKRSWEYWEREERPIKEDVKEKIKSLLERRKQVLKMVIEQGENAHKIAVIYYNTPEYCASVLEWRFTQSLASTIALDFGASLVEFDYKDYKNFCEKQKLEDNQQSRSMWAAWKSGNKNN
nr:DUF1870 family protein [uncultured Haemophilus sp.]